MTSESFNAAFEDAEEHVAEPPRPLIREMPPPEPFPVDCLGKLLGNAANAIHDSTQAPVAIGAQSVIATATLAVQGHADVVLPTEQVKPISSFFVTIAATGERKSACDNRALAPVHGREEVLRKEYDQDLIVYNNQKDAWDKQRTHLLADKKKYPDHTAKAQALNDLGPPPSPPHIPMLTCPEPTYEGLCRLLAVGQPSIGIFSAEGGQFIGGHGMTEDAKLRTAAGLSALWDGESVKRVRAGDGVTLLPGRRVCLHLMAQPDVAAVMLSDPVFADQGLLSRTLIAAPQTAMGTRLWHEPQPASRTALNKYEAILLRLLEEPFPLASGTTNELLPRPLSLSPAARENLILFSDHVEKIIAPGGELEPIRGLANKLPEHAARLSAVLTLVEDLKANEISANQIAAGIELAQFYAGEALRLFAAGLVSADLRLAQRLLDWLTASWQEDLISLVDIYQRGPNQIRDKTKAKQLVKILEEHGWLVRQDQGGIVAGQRRREVWRIIRGGSQ